MFENTLWTEKSYRQFYDYLNSLKDEKYRQFHGKLVPDIDGLIGVQIPKLRFIAKEISKGDIKGFLYVCKGNTYEERQIQGMVIGTLKDEILFDAYFLNFLPMISNWAECDCFCSGLKIVKRFPKKYFEIFCKLTENEHVFTVRAGFVGILAHFLEKENLPKIFELCQQKNYKEYYIDMAIAWLLSVCYVKFPAETSAFLRDCRLSDFVFNKTIQKSIESRRISDKDKALLKIMRRK